MICTQVHVVKKWFLFQPFFKDNEETCSVAFPSSVGGVRQARPWFGL